jgi:hypothetical protein
VRHRAVQCLGLDLRVPSQEDLSPRDRHIRTRPPEESWKPRWKLNTSMICAGVVPNR